MEPAATRHDTLGVHLQAELRGLGIFRDQIVDGSSAILISMVLISTSGRA